jgi:hypothetical protein
VTDAPSPHPLDFDWRYDRQTTDRLVAMLEHAGPVVALGVPSVARALEEREVAVTLVDRQPVLGIRSHTVTAVEGFDAPNKFSTAIVDPPWYPKQLLAWSLVAGRAVGVGGSAFISVWPDWTRPGARRELAAVLEEISSWAAVERGVATLGYTEPLFEAAARAYGVRQELARSPLQGELVCLKVLRSPQRARPLTGQEDWWRFTVDDYQLALRMDRPTGQPLVAPIMKNSGWAWPYVSARAPCREQIGLWSSSGEAAAIGDPAVIATALRAAFLTTDEKSFEAAFTAAPELLSWRIPRPPFRRFIEWQHRQ